MKKISKILALVLALAMSVTCFAACGNKDTQSSDSSSSEEQSSTDDTSSEASITAADLAAIEDYNEQSAAIYDLALSDFLEVYEKAKEADTLSERWALMACAEAKMLESAVFLPTTTDGGMYAISRVAPNTIDYTLWGNDSYRYHQALVCTEPLKTEDRAEMKEKWGELKGTGTWMEWAENYLTEKGYTLKDTYTLGYSSDPKTWDVLSTSRAADSEAIINTYDGLLEYDPEGELQPALAESYEVSDDGLTYTFHLREGVKWVDAQGREVADLKADDFVAGFQHMMDTMGGLEYLVQGVIVNADEYINGVVTDMSEVGVKAVDDLTVEYTLCEPTAYFTTMLGYGVFAPMSRSYYESQGGKFGADFNAEDESYNYGKDPNTIAYCGPYTVTNSTAENTIVFKANPSYWNADGINVKTITWLYNDGSDVTKAYNDMKAGTIDGCSLSSSSLELAKNDGWFDQYHYVSSTQATTYGAFMNINRTAYANANDETTVVSSKTDDQKTAAYAAMLNVHFRRALAFGVDRSTYNAQVVGEDVKLLSLRNTYVPGTFMSLTEETTIEINGTPTTFAEGTYYGEVLQAQLDADGSSIKAWDPDADDGIGSSDGFDGWYNPEEAAAELAIAVEELKESDGIEITAENPIYIDLPYPQNSEIYTNHARAFKDSVEASLGGLVVINMVACNDYSEWYYAGYYTNYGYEANYDLYDLSGWGPDYGDPQTYLDTFLDEYAGYMIKCIGIY